MAFMALSAIFDFKICLYAVDDGLLLAGGQG